MTRMKSNYLALIAVLLSPMAANAIPIEITGTASSDGTWEITTILGTWDDLLSQLMGQEWWDDASLALVFADTLSDGLGFPWVDTLGPLFAIDPTQYERPDMFAACNTDLNCGLYFGLGDSIATWAIAERVASVPEPGTLALLAIGLFGMGLARRKKQL